MSATKGACPGLSEFFRRATVVPEYRRRSTSSVRREILDNCIEGMRGPDVVNFPLQLLAVVSKLYAKITVSRLPTISAVPASFHAMGARKINWSIRRHSRSPLGQM